MSSSMVDSDSSNKICSSYGDLIEGKDCEKHTLRPLRHHLRPVHYVCFSIWPLKAVDTEWSEKPRVDQMTGNAFSMEGSDNGVNGDTQLLISAF